MALTTVQSGLLGSDAQALSFRNRIINGDMRIDQRNAGASVANGGTTIVYGVDRWQYVTAGSGPTGSAQRVTDAPAGFTNSLKITANSASLASSAYSLVLQHVEGVYFDDLNWGTSNAAPITVSFWIKASVTGVYSVFLRNIAAYTKFYISTVSVASANTWQYVSFTVPGETTATWAGGTSGALQIGINVGSGTGYAGASANTWQNGTQFATSSSVNMHATNGSTLQITGFQVEKGTVATPFETRPYGMELALCQRYFEKSYSIDQAVGTSGATAGLFSFTAGINSSGYLQIPLRFAVAKRSSPSITAYRLYPATVNTWDYWRSGAGGTITPSCDVIGTSGCRITANIGGSYVVGGMEGHWTADSEL